MNLEELLWKYADGECSPAEKAAVEARLLDDPAFEEELKLVQAISDSLKGITPEQPSMRFTQNVMEALPSLYYNVSIEPLVSPVWKKIFGGMVAGLSVLLFFLPLQNGDEVSNSMFAERMTDGINSTIGLVPMDVLQYFVMVLFAFAGLVVMDKLLAIKGIKLL